MVDCIPRAAITHFKFVRKLILKQYLRILDALVVVPKPARFTTDRSEIAFISIYVFALELSNFYCAISQKEYSNLHVRVVVAKRNFWRLSEYELAGNEIFLRHENSGDWG